MLHFCENIKARIKPAGPLGLLCRARAGLGLRLDQKLRASSLQKARENCSSRAGLGLGPRPVAPLLKRAIGKNGSPVSAMTAIFPHWSMAKWPILDKLSGFEKSQKTYEAISSLVLPYIDQVNYTIHSILDF